jgi:chromosome partitioning protein
MDPQAALTVSSGIQMAQLSRSIYQALLDDSIDPASLIQDTNSGVAVLPATLDLAAAELELASAISREMVLREVLTKLKPSYDHILIDCPPNLGLLTINALAAADQILIPVACEYLAIRGIPQLMRTVEKIRRINRNISIVGILATRYKSNLVNSNEILEELRTNFPSLVLTPVIRESVRIQEAPIEGLSILDYDKKNPAAEAYKQVAVEVDHA